ncbi:MAG: SelB C-terminal domain-containing protein [Candidatus Melainabacteria bacterium]|nr:SelB C-terminal domain-containing protein [Candidatus Melainabacteria bacterium]
MSTENNPQNTEPIGTLHFTLATAGHVDHGKTSVLRALTGMDPDRLKEEKERQMTIDLGFAHMRVSREDVQKSGASQLQRFEDGLGDALTAKSELVIGFVDVPGHGKFLKNMLAGVGGMDMALIVVAADEGVMPQTVQHVKILTLLGVRECILVINKIDLADEDQKELAITETEDFLERFGIKVLETVEFSCASDKTTAALKDAIVKHVLSMPLRDRKHDSSGKLLPSFLSIDRVFSKAGHGAVVTGTLTKGIIKVGDEIRVQPGSIGARVRGLQTFNHKLERANPGQRLAINLALKENKRIERGHAVVGDDTAAVDTLIVQITDLGGLEASNDVSGEGLKPQSVRFYHGTAERYAFLRWIQPIGDLDEDTTSANVSSDRSDAIEDGNGGKGDKSTNVSGERTDGKSSKTQDLANHATNASLASNASASNASAGNTIASHARNANHANLRQPLVGQLVLTEPLIAGPGEKYIIRYGDYGIAGGEILMTTRPRWLSRAMLKPLTEKICRGDLAAATLELINLAPQRSVGKDLIDALLPDFERRDIMAKLATEGQIEKVDDRYITRDEKQDLVDKILEALQKAEATGSRDASISQETLRVEIAPLVDRAIFQAIVKELLTSNRIIKNEERLALPSAAAAGDAVDGTVAAYASMVSDVLDSNFCLEIEDIAEQAGIDKKDVLEGLVQLEKEGRAALINYEFASSSESILKAHEALVSIWNKHRNINPGDFREAIGSSRKYAMALLAYFDDRKVTRRMPNGRVLLKAPPKKQEQS